MSSFVSPVSASVSVFAENAPKPAKHAPASPAVRPPLPNAATPSLEQFVTRKHVCAALQLHRDTLRRWAIEGKLVPVVFSGRFLRYRLKDLERLARESCYRPGKKTGPKPRKVYPPAPLKA